MAAIECIIFLMIRKLKKICDYKRILIASEKKFLRKNYFKLDYVS